MPSRSWEATALYCHSSRRGESVITLVLPGEGDPTEDQGTNSPVVSSASAGRAKGGCLHQGLLAHRDPGEADTGPECLAESRENSSIVHAAHVSNGRGGWLIQDTAGHLPKGRDEQEERKGQESA